MRNFRPSLLPVLFSLALSLFLTSLAWADRTDQIDSPDRLNFINQATGNSNNSDSFQSRLDAVLSTTPSVERSLVAAEDASAREKITAKAEESESEGLKSLSPERYNPKKNQDATKILDSASDKSKFDATEKGYEKAREEIQKEFDERISKKSEKNKENTTTEASGGKKSGLLPSLANNPFYTGESHGDTDFDSKKAVIVSRLIARGVSQETATSEVNQASSADELVISLMKEHDFSYGEAADTTS